MADYEYPTDTHDNPATLVYTRAGIAGQVECPCHPQEEPDDDPKCLRVLTDSCNAGICSLPMDHLGMCVVLDHDDGQVKHLTLNGMDPFEKLLIEMVELNRAKRNDYAGSDDPWQNFHDSANQVNDTAGKSVETLIATKQARLRQLLFTGREAKNESVRDTLRDRAVYAVIALSLFDQGHYERARTDGN